MYAYVKDNAIKKIINNARSWNDPETKIQHPSNIFSLWSKSDLAKINLYPVEQATQPNSEFNSIGGSSYTFDADNNKVVETISSSEKSLSDSTITKDDGTKYTNKGLKTVWIEKTKEIAKKLLEMTDWYIVRNAEDDTKTIPNKVTEYRKSVRTASDAIETNITNASDMTAFKSLFDIPTDSDGKPTGKAPILDFPESFSE